MIRLSPERLLEAYAAGVFPMARHRDERRLYWVDPDRRGILPLETFHVPRSLRKVMARQPFELRCNSAFAAVIAACGEPAPDRPDSWINAEIREMFIALHRMGFAHSVECWRDGRLVGGLYGLALGAAFFGESMFSRETDASKVALVDLVGRLTRGGFVLLDTQFVTSHLARFGAIEIPRTDYRRRLAVALARPAWFDPGPGGDQRPAAGRQSSTHRS